MMTTKKEIRQNMEKSLIEMTENLKGKSSLGEIDECKACVEVIEKLVLGLDIVRHVKFLDEEEK